MGGKVDKDLRYFTGPQLEKVVKAGTAKNTTQNIYAIAVVMIIANKEEKRGITLSVAEKAKTGLSDSFMKSTKFSLSIIF